MTGQARNPRSLARRGAGFGVSASPLNAVKLDLGIIMICGVLLLLLQGLLDAAESVRIAILLVYGVAGMIWLIVRSRRVMKSLERDNDGA